MKRRCPYIEPGAFAWSANTGERKHSWAASEKFDDSAPATWLSVKH